MHKITFFAKTYIVALFYSIIILYIVIIFPIFLNVYVYYNAQTNKIFVCVYTFKIIKLIAFYIQFTNQDIIIHLTERRAIIIPYNKLLTMKMLKLKLPSQTGIINFSGKIAIGGVDNIQYKTLLLNTLNILSVYFFSYLNNTNYHGKYRLDKTYILTENLFEVSCYFKIVFNFISIIITLLNKLLGVIHEKYRKRKQDKRNNCINN